MSFTVQATYLFQSYTFEVSTTDGNRFVCTRKVEAGERNAPPETIRIVLDEKPKEEVWGKSLSALYEELAKKITTHIQSNSTHPQKQLASTFLLLLILEEFVKTAIYRLQRMTFPCLGLHCGMAYAVKFSGFSYQALVKFLTEGSGKAYMDAFNPAQQLIIYPKDNPFASPVYLVTDIDVFPPASTHLMLKTLFEPVGQKAFDELCHDLSLHSFEGDASLAGQDAFRETPQ